MFPLLLPTQSLQTRFFCGQITQRFICSTWDRPKIDGRGLISQLYFPPSDCSSLLTNPRQFSKAYNYYFKLCVFSGYI